MTNPEEVAQNIDENTIGLYLEIISNPQMEVADLAQLSDLAKKKNIPLIADTTIVPFCAFNAKNFGVNIEVVSSTKYISGGATSLGGLIIDYGTFNWKNNKQLAPLAEQFGNSAFTVRLKKEIHRNLGAYMSAHTAQTQILGLETLSLRFNKAAVSCLQLAQKLENLPQIKSVIYTGLENSPYYKVSKRQFGMYPGAMFAFTLESKEACFRFLNNLKLIKRATNLFDNKTLIIHPASTIYGTFPVEIREKMHVSENLIRISLGLEDIEDIFSDIKQALA
jgi:O-acetylhomoserine (thiol)-lyase